MKMFKATNRIIFTALLTCAAFSAQAFEALQCPIGEPIAAWDFNKGDLPSEKDIHVEWNGDHDGVKDIPETELQGIKFRYRGKGPEGDASSEWRYKINMPLSRTWEYLRIYQPVNFHHRYFVRIETPSVLNEAEWRVGDIVENPWGLTAKIGAINNNYIFIENFRQRFDKNWGNGLILQNLNTGATVEAVDSRSVTTNNKFSAQWQGRYSNGGMIVETQAKVPDKGGEVGVSYFRPTINKSKAHKASGTVSNQLGDVPGTAFDPRDNATVIELVIERIRSSAEGKRDGSYQIWKRTEGSSWSLIHKNTSIYAWQPDNYFDHGYVFGWANSGYTEDTDFYLLGWQLWAEKPAFLP